MCLCFWVIVVLSEGVQTSFMLCDIFIPCMIQSFFLLFVLLYLTGKLASKIFRKDLEMS
jgi:heme/copper-type cytochrome/quinol oxidase subunit 4